MKVFISYARADVGLAENLRQQLEDAGYLPLIDRYDIDTTDTWKVRLRELIHACDAVVCVLTPRAAGSLTCAWEAEEAARAGKLLLPAIYEPIGHVAPPLGLANFIYFHPNPADPRSGPYFGWLKLDEALRAQAPAPPKKKLIGSARKEKTMAQAAAKPPPRKRRKGSTFGSVVWGLFFVILTGGAIAGVAYFRPLNEPQAAPVEATAPTQPERQEQAQQAQQPQPQEQRAVADPITWQEARRGNRVLDYWRYVTENPADAENQDDAIARTRSRIRALGGRPTSRYMRMSGAVPMREVPSPQSPAEMTRLNDDMTLLDVIDAGRSGKWYVFERKGAPWPFLFAAEADIAPPPRRGLGK